MGIRGTFVESQNCAQVFWHNVCIYNVVYTEISQISTDQKKRNDVKNRLSNPLIDICAHRQIAQRIHRE